MAAEERGPRRLRVLGASGECLEAAGSGASGARSATARAFAPSGLERGQPSSGEFLSAPRDWRWIRREAEHLVETLGRVPFWASASSSNSTSLA